MMCVSYCLDLFLLVVALSSYSTCSLWLKEENKYISSNCTNLFNFPVLIWLVSNVWDFHLNDAMEMISLPPANEVCEGYVFTGVCLSGGVRGRGVCMAGGHVRGGGGHVRGWGHVHACPPADTTRYGQCAGGTHPTGMHSCLLELILFMGCIKNTTAINISTFIAQQ